jgi:hypothetical protein
MRAVIITLLLASLTGCFPHNAKHRKIAKWSEGGAIVGGIAMLAVSNTGADCTAGPAGRQAYDECRRDATLVGNIGLGLILAGLVGFGITQMTSGDGETAPPPKPLLSEDQTDLDAAKPTLPGRAALKPAN